jgi:hypothetical protein
MLYDKLPNVGDICSTGFRLRVDCAHAVSAVEIAAGGSASGKASAAKLRDFFIACANAADKAAGNSGSAVTADGVVLGDNQAVITDGDAVEVQNSVGDTQAAAAATVVVVNQSLSAAKITAGTTAVVANGDSIVVNDNGGTPDAKSPGTATVADGVLSDVTLSA